MRITERYKLVFSWEGIRYEGDVAYFTRAAFSGPVIAMMAKVEPSDFIDLDLSDQSFNSPIFLPKSYYIARLAWREVVYRSWGIELMEASLSHQKVGSLKELKDGMKLYINCSNHEHTIHHKHLVYPAWVVKADGEELK